MKNAQSRKIQKIIIILPNTITQSENKIYAIHGIKFEFVTFFFQKKGEGSCIHGVCAKYERSMDE